MKSLLALFIYAEMLFMGYRKWGWHAVVFNSYRSRHGSNGARSKSRARRWQLSHTYGVPVNDVLETTGEHLLPSMYYPHLAPSVKGMAHAA